jgi:phasin family protein
MTRKSLFPEFNLNLPKFDWTEMLGTAKLKAIEPNQVIEAHRKNLEAFTKAQTVLAQGFQTIAQRQAEMLRGSMTGAGSMMKTMMQERSVDASAQANTVKAALEAQVAHMREMTEMVGKVQGEAMTILRDRLVESMAEVRGDKVAPKSSAKTAEPVADTPAPKPAPAAKPPVKKAVSKAPARKTPPKAK